MSLYPKIQSLFKRTEKGVIVPGKFSEPVFEYLQDNTWLFREKVDGTNIRLTWNGTDYEIGGRTEAAQIPATLIQAIRSLVSPAQFRAEFGDDPVTIYCEGYGKKIQKRGALYRDDQSIVVFDILVGRWWLREADVRECAKALGLEVVPPVGFGDLNDLVAVVSKGMTSQYGNFEAEGIVAIPEVQIFNRLGERVITKLKTADFKRLEAQREQAAHQQAH